MRYLLDTNIILHYLKGSSIKDAIKLRYAPFSPSNDALISIVTIAEIKAVAKKNNWGKVRLEAVSRILERMIVIDIRHGELLELYAEIDAYSQGKSFGPEDEKFSARNMGKNDLWIAASAALTDATLLSTDQDFKHLNKKYIKVEVIE